MAKRNMAASKPSKATKDAAKAAKVDDPGGGAPDLDRLIHERVRLGLVSALAVGETMTFNELKAALRVTDGNLSAHARRLEEAGYVECEKVFAGRTPRTSYRLSPTGRRALQRYLAHMEALIEATREGGAREEGR